MFSVVSKKMKGKIRKGAVVVLLAASSDVYKRLCKQMPRSLLGSLGFRGYDDHNGDGMVDLCVWKKVVLLCCRGRQERNDNIHTERSFNQVQFRGSE